MARAPRGTEGPFLGDAFVVAGHGRASAETRLVGIRTGAASPPTGRQGRAGRVFTIALITPTVVYFVMWVFLPVAYGVYISLTNASFVSRAGFVGIENYRSILTSGQWWSSVGRTGKYLVEVVPPTLLVSFVMARLITRCRRGQSVLLTIYFLPYVVPGVVAALVFVVLFQRYGLVNSIFHLSFGWLTNPGLALYAVSITTMWALIGYYVLIFLAGYQQVPQEFLEAARLDGATVSQLVRYVELPLLRPTLMFCFITSTAFVLTNFGTPFVMTGGGPANATTTVPLLIYDEAFKYSSAGVGEAMAMVLLFGSLILTAMQVRLLFRQRGEGRGRA